MSEVVKDLERLRNEELAEHEAAHKAWLDNPFTKEMIKKFKKDHEDTQTSIVTFARAHTQVELERSVGVLEYLIHLANGAYFQGFSGMKRAIEAKYLPDKGTIRKAWRI